MPTAEEVLQFWFGEPGSQDSLHPRDFWFTVTLAVGVATVMEGLLLALLGYGLIRSGLAQLKSSNLVPSRTTTHESGMA